jgi:hypothetical protein
MSQVPGQAHRCPSGREAGGVEGAPRGGRGVYTRLWSTGQPNDSLLMLAP